MSALEPSICVRFPGDGEVDPPVVVTRKVAQQFKYFQRVMDGEFQEGQERQVCIEKISRSTGLVVLQQEVDIVKSLTKDNLMDAMIALDYLQFETDKIFTPGSNQSLLWGIHRKMVGDGWLHDRKLANSLLDSFSRYAFVARFIYQHKDFCTGLLPALLKKPDVIRAQWRRCERGEDADDAIKAAMSLSDSLGDGLSCGRIDVSRQEIAQFITAATGSTSLAAAHRSVFERDIFTPFATSSTHPFANNQRGSARCGGINFKVAALPHPYTPSTSPDPPPNAMDDADAKVADVGGWRITFDSVDDGAPRESFATCFAPDASLEIACGDDGDGKPAAACAADISADASQKAIRLHESFTRIHMGDDGPSVRRFTVQMLEGRGTSCTHQRNISAASFAQQGVGEARLKDVKMTLMVRRFPMRALGLHYLRLCAKEGQWDQVTHMAKSIHLLVAGHMLRSLSSVRHHRLPLVLFWASALGPVGFAPDVLSLWTTDPTRQNLDDVAAVLPIISSLPLAMQAAFEDALKNAIDPQNKELFAKMLKTLNKEAADRRRLEAENEDLRRENATLNEELRRAMEGQQQR